MARIRYPTRTEMHVLQILCDAPRGLSGMEIVERGISEGSVYVLLSRLEDKGFIIVKRVKSEYPGLKRSHYRINADGLYALSTGERLGAMLAEV